MSNKTGSPIIEKIKQEEKCTLKKLKMKAIEKIELFYL